MVIQRLRPLFSGQGVQVEELCRELARRDVRVTILTAGHGRNPPWETVDGYRIRRLRADIPWLSSRLQPGRFRSEIFGVRAFIWLMLHGWRTQLLHTHTLSDALYSSWLFARLRGIPLIFEMTLLGTDDALSFAGNRHRFRRLRNRIFRRCDGYVAISPALARAYEQAGLPPKKLRLIPQGVDINRFRPTEDVGARRQVLGIPVHGAVVVFVGSLIERKGIDLLLAAWEEVHAANPNASLVLVGRNEFTDDPAAAAFLEDHLGRLSEGALGRVLQTGVRPDVEEYLRAADLFAFPSRREGFGTVMIEAMATSLPCVVAELPDITDYIFAADGSTGTMVPRDDAGALAGELCLLLADSDRATAMGAAARQRVAERFSVTRVADDYLDFYAWLAAGEEES